MHETEAIDPSELKDWDELLSHTPGRSFFHTSAWAETLRGSYG